MTDLKWLTEKLGVVPQSLRGFEDLCPQAKNLDLSKMMNLSPSGNRLGLDT